MLWNFIVNYMWFKVLSKKLVKDGTSQFQNFYVISHKFYALIHTRILQLGWKVSKRG
jgi:hypothetical protein